MNKKVLITGVSGFIGFSVAQRLLQEGYEVWGVDRPNKRMPLKDKRNIELDNQPNFHRTTLDLANLSKTLQFFKGKNFSQVLHFAAQFSVTHTRESAISYVNSNCVAFVNLLEACAEYKVTKFIYASSSWADAEKATSLYASTKKFNESAAHVYTHNFGIQTIGLRISSTYGPWMRPDMAVSIFADRIKNNKKIEPNASYNGRVGLIYIDDVVDSVLQYMDYTDEKYYVYKICSPHPAQNHWEIIQMLEKHIGKKAIIAGKRGEIIGVGNCPTICEAIPKTVFVTPDDGIKHYCQWLLQQ